MPTTPFFVQRCPSCCRQLRIDVEFLGLSVICHHCDKSFVARDGSLEPATLMDPINYWIQQADCALGENGALGGNGALRENGGMAPHTSADRIATPQIALAFRPR